MTEEMSPDLENPDSPTQLRALAADKVACTYAYGPDLRKAANEIERLRKALKFYADGWDGHPGDSGPGGIAPADPTWSPENWLIEDGGKTAREALGDSESRGCVFCKDVYFELEEHQRCEVCGRTD